MIRSILSASIAAIAMAGAAQAQDMTFSAGWERADFDGADFDTAVVRGAYFFNENFGVEGQLNIGVGDEEFDLGVTTVDVSMDYGVGAFAVGRIASSENFNLLGRLGYVHAELEADAANITVSEDDGAFAVGVAAEWFFDASNGVRFDYTHADFDDSVSFYGISYVRRFGG
ncbi:MAG: porin family protein [Alphaproteobacteria bacterium]|nr:porin family protein [Alphaproteobacteria bacterium]